MGFALRGKLKWGTVLAAAILTLILAVPVLADYIGPDREVTTWSEQRLRCEYQAVYDPPPPAQGAHGCLLVFLYVPSGTCPDAAGLGSYFNPTNCSEPPDYTWPIASCVGSYCSISFSGGLEPCSAGDYGCESIPTTVTYPEATISGSLQGCTLQNGWCVTNSTLVLTGTEPVAGQQIIGIEGTLNGQGFGYPFLPGAAVESASVPLGEGVNTLTFWALSSWGDSSQRGTFSANVDTWKNSCPASGAKFNSEAWRTGFSPSSARAWFKQR